MLYPSGQQTKLTAHSGSAGNPQRYLSHMAYSTMLQMRHLLQITHNAAWRRPMALSTFHFLWHYAKFIDWMLFCQEIRAGYHSILVWQRRRSRPSMVGYPLAAPGKPFSIFTLFCLSIWAHIFWFQPYAIIDFTHLGPFIYDPTDNYFLLSFSAFSCFWLNFQFLGFISSNLKIKFIISICN